MLKPTIVLGALSVTAIAHAQLPPVCPAPTRDQCYENPLDRFTYWTTTCGRWQRQQMATDPAATCNQVYLSANVDAPMAIVPVPPNTPQTGGYDITRDAIASATIERHDIYSANMVMHGDGSSPSALQAAYGVQQTGGTVQLTSMLPDALRSSWESNGNSVATCQEYAYERYYDYSVYADELTRAGEDYRAVTDYGIALLVDGVDSRAGAPVWSFPESSPQPKNLYFAYRHLYPPAIKPDEKHPFTESGIPDERGASYYTHSMEWHAFMNTALQQQAHPDELLYALAQKQRDFAKLLAERAAIYRHWVLFDEALSAGHDDCTRKLTPRQIRALHPLDQIWNPGNYTPGADLLALYGRDGFTGVLEPVPEALAAEVPAGASIYSSKVVDYATGVHATTRRLAASPLDPLALQNMQIYQQSDSGDLGTNYASNIIPPSGATVINGVAVSAQCMGYVVGELPRPEKPSCSGHMLMFPCSAQMQRLVAAKLRAVDEKIERAFLEVKPYHCLALPSEVDTSLQTKYSPCDWSPEMFVAETRDKLVREREKAFDQCGAIAGVDFSGPESLIRNAITHQIATDERTARVGVPKKQDYTGSTEDVFSYIKLFTAFAAELDFGIDANNKPIAGHSKGGNSSLGNGDFGISFSYAAGWRLNGLPTTMSAGLHDNPMCNLELTADARAGATGTLFGRTFQLAELGAKLKNSRVDGATRATSAELTVQILGHDVLVDHERNGIKQAAAGGQMSFFISKSDSRSYAGPSKRFFVAWFPVIVRSAVVGSAGFTLDARGSVGGACGVLNALGRQSALDTSLQGKLQPHASLDVLVSAGVDVAVLDVGIELGLTLLRVDLPLTLSFALRPFKSSPVLLPDFSYSYPPSPYDNQASILAQPKLELALTVLAGRVRAYVRPIIGPSHYKTLFSWEGIEVARRTLFAPTWNYPLSTVAVGLAARKQHP